MGKSRLHAHSHAHDHAHGESAGHAGVGHNRDHAAPLHLHSHLPPEEEAEDIKVLSMAFIEGFQSASDKAAYLSLAGVPLEIADPKAVDRAGEGGADGTPLKLVDVVLKTEWQVGTASPAFGSRELSYLPLPGSMIAERTNMVFLYVSLDRREEVDLRTFLKSRM